MGASNAAEKEQRTDSKDRLGGARADFVANLGRRRAELRTTLDALRADPASKRHRDELRRRIHALAAGAKLLRFGRLADELKGVEDLLEEAAQRGQLDDPDFGAVHDLVGRMTSLAWGQEEEQVGPRVFAKAPAPLRESSFDAPVLMAPLSVLVVGADALADALTLPVGRSSVDGAPSYEVERTAMPSEALDLARALAPDLIVVDADLGDVQRLVEALVSDSLTESIPIVACKKLVRQSESGPLLALGVAKVLAKPVAPGELRRTCAAVVATYVKKEVSREPLGDIDIDALGAKLAEELRRGLCDTLDPKARGAVVSLGEGTEVLAALWGAVARIRDVVTIRSQGQVRFALGGPEGAFPMASWLDEAASVPGTRRSSLGGLARSGPETTLEKVRILVADDDAAICWFLAGVLKTAGATVYEARDGERALEIAKHCEPDIIISDVLMPKMDGFSLCRAVKHDLVLRDVPVVLLSWKEDLLQRVRELGAEADGYLRKEASAGAIVQRVRELVRGRSRVAERLATNGEVRGRLDGLTAYSLLRFVCEKRPSSSMSVRDASYLYEVEVRGGRPARATRTSMDGSFDRGSSVLAALLGVGDGRFVVAPPREDHDVAPVRVDLDGALTDQLAPVIASARAAQGLLTGANLPRVGRVEIDEEALAAYWGATPEPARRIVTALSRGESPRALVASGVASARLVEDVLVDVAGHGSVVQIFDVEGNDRLPEATSLELALLRGDRSASPIHALPLPTGKLETPSPALPVTVQMPHHAQLLKAAFAQTTSTSGELELFVGTKEPLPFEQPMSFEQPAYAAPDAAALLGAVTLDANTELDDAQDDLHDPWFASVDVSGSSIARDEESPIPSSGPRAMTPPPKSPEPSFALGSLSPPPAITKRAPTPRPMVATRELTPTPSSLPPPPGLKPMLSLGSLHPPPVDSLPPTPTPRPKNLKKSPKPGAVAESGTSSPKAPDVTPKFAMPSAFLPKSELTVPKKDRRALYWVAFAMCGVAFAGWARWSREKSLVSETTMMAEVQGAAPTDTTAPAATDAPAADTAEPTADAATDTPKAEDIAPEDLPLRDHDKVKKGQGLLEVVTGRSDSVYIDGKAVGSGPVVAIPLKARTEPYVVRVRTHGEERTRSISVKEGRLTRLRVAPPWQR